MNDPFASKLSRRNLFRFGAAGLLGSGALGMTRLLSPRAAGLPMLQDGVSVEDARYEGIRE